MDIFPRPDGATSRSGDPEMRSLVEAVAMHGSMAKSLLTLLAGVGAGLYPLLAFALGFGEIQVDSRLNEPLRARIEIVAVGDEDWRQFHARVPAQTAGDDAMHPELLGSITLRVTEDANHRHFIEASSTDVFTEPMFDLPIELAGPTVRVIRSYPILLDPAALASEPQERVAQPSLSEGPPTPVPDGAHQQPESSNTNLQAADIQHGGSSAHNEASRNRGGSSRRAEVSGNQPEVSRDNSKVSNSNVLNNRPDAVYTVPNSDTLERIARRLGGRTAAERMQLMQWIFAHNPRAFYGDMDHLHSGAHLTVPENAIPREGGVTPQKTSTEGTSEGKSDSKSDRAADSALQAQLEQQLVVLQQTLTTMQRTISEQDAEISKLTVEVATRAKSVAVQPKQLASAADSSDDSDDDELDESSGRRAMVRWTAGAVAATVLVLGLAWMIRKKRVASQRPVEAQGRAQFEAASVASGSAQARSEPQHARSESRRPGSGADQNASQGKNKGNHPGELDEDLWRSPNGFESWRDLNAAPRKEAVSNTGRMPLVVDYEVREEPLVADAGRHFAGAGQGSATAQQASAAVGQSSPGTGQNSPGAGQKSPTAAQSSPALAPKAPTAPQTAPSMHEASLFINKEINRILEDSLDQDSERVDFKIKLLELHHHEVLGNREEFYALVSQLVADPNGLSPEQRAHIEKLQQTLRESTSEIKTKRA
jgi:hypothetical protein